MDWLRSARKKRSRQIFRRKDISCIASGLLRPFKGRLRDEMLNEQALMTGQVRLECVGGLLHQRIAVGKEQHPLHPICPHQ